MRTPSLSPVELPSLDLLVPPWPGTHVPTRGGPVFVRHTPWSGPVEGTAVGGPPGGGAPVGATPADGRPERALYVHGLGGASTNWTDVAALLAVRFDGYALDLPGFGASEPPAGGGYPLLRHVQAVVDVLEWVADQPGPPGTGPGPDSPRPRVHLVGNSLGGLVSVLVAARRPDLVASLTLISPAMPVYRVPPAFQRAILLVLLPGIPALASRRMADISAEQRVRGMLQMCFGDPGRVPEERVREAVAEMRARDAQPWAGLALTRSLRGLMTAYLRPGRGNAWRVARRITCPALVVWGDRDRLVDPRLAPRLVAALPDARLLVLPGIGHVAMMEAPEPTARAVLGLAEEVAAGAGPADVPAPVGVRPTGRGRGPSRRRVTGNGPRHRPAAVEDRDERRPA